MQKENRLVRPYQIQFAADAFCRRKMQGMYPFSDSVFLMYGDSKVIVKSRIGKKGKKILPLSAYKAQF